MTLIVVSGIAMLAAPVSAGDEPTTEDVLFMKDNRELHGHIITETADTLVFEVVDRRYNLRSTLTFAKEDVYKISRDLPIEVKQEVDPLKSRSARTDRSGDAETGVALRQSRFGKSRYATDDPNVPGLYIVPMKGQLGTDIHPSIFERVVEDIRVAKPDLVVIVMDCKDKDDLMIPLNEATEQGLFMHHEYRKIVDSFRDDLADIPQVMWVEDSVGFSSLLAMSWPKIYMTPQARLGGLSKVADRAGGWSDTDVAAKMMAAWTGIGRGFLENGGYPRQLADAMMRPHYKLSASFKGREIEWSLDEIGEFLVDNDEEATVGFKAKAAEDLLISEGTCDTLDDLAFLIGFREFRIMDNAGERMIDTYIEKWRGAYDKTKNLWTDYQDHNSWASGDETLKYLGAAKRDLEQIVRTMKVYPAVETRWRTDRGFSRQQLEIEIEKMKEKIQALKRSNRGGGGGGGGFGVGGG